MRPRRTPVLLVVAALLVGGGVADRRAGPSDRLAAGAADRELMPTASPAGALSSTWFCVGAGAGPGTAADGVVVVANPGSEPATGTVTAYRSEGAPQAAPVTVGPGAIATVGLRDVAPAPWTAAVVDLDAGQVGAELVVNGSGESDAVACSSRASSRWYFADGVTAKDASLTLSLLNPFPEDAIVELSFSTDQGRTSPVELSPVVVPGRSLVTRDIGANVRRRNAIATTVRARAGRVVAAQTQVRTAAGKAGLSVSLGAPSLGTEWHFPGVAPAADVQEHFAIYNPGAGEARVLVQIGLDEGVTTDLDRVVPARDRIDVVLDEESGVPRGVGHAVSVLSLDGRPVVASRTVELASADGRRGRADTLGARRAATRWLFSAGASDTEHDEYLVVANPGDTKARVDLQELRGGVLAIGERGGALEVGPGRRAVVRLRDHVQRFPEPVVVSSSVPVVAERLLYLTGRPGVWATVGVPLG